MIARLAAFAYLAAAAVFLSVRDLWRRAGWRARGVRVSRGAILRFERADAIELAPGVIVGTGTLLVATTERSALPPEASRLRVGAGTAINEYCNLRASGGEIAIGRQCLIAQMVTIVASNHSTGPGRPMIEQPWSAEPHSVRIGDDVWLGAGVTVLPGARIGDGAVIAAGAVVRGEVPPGEIWGGVPARFIRRRG
jgi:carbonic anhydrase/acetyltransferase-like protein (isoleucine patch superfamily)